MYIVLDAPTFTLPPGRTSKSRGYSDDSVQKKAHLARSVGLEIGKEELAPT